HFKGRWLDGWSRLSRGGEVSRVAVRSPHFKMGHCSARARSILRTVGNRYPLAAASDDEASKGEYRWAAGDQLAWLSFSRRLPNCIIGRAKSAATIRDLG